MSAEFQKIPSFSGKNAFEYLEKQVAFGPRTPGSPEHDQCRNFLISELLKFTTSVRTQDFEEIGLDGKRQISFSNIIANFPGTANGKQKILLAAHWDTRVIADQDSDPEKRTEPVPGANDGASGVAVLLEVAKILSVSPPPVPVEIVFFDGEDYGNAGEVLLTGSKEYALTVDPSAFKFGILIDMIGDKDLKIPKEEFSNKMLPSLVKSVWNRARKLKIKAFSSKIGPDIIDDHRPLIEAGVPIIDLIDFNYKYWHTTEDTPDKCSPESLEKVGKLLLSLVFEGL